MIFVVITAAIDSDFSCEMALMMVDGLELEPQSPAPRPATALNRPRDARASRAESERDISGGAQELCFISQLQHPRSSARPRDLSERGR